MRSTTIFISNWLREYITAQAWDHDRASEGRFFYVRLSSALQVGFCDATEEHAEETFFNFLDFVFMVMGGWVAFEEEVLAFELAEIFAVIRTTSRLTQNKVIICL
jgi:hypothetical protein